MARPGVQQVDGGLVTKEHEPVHRKSAEHGRPEPPEEDRDTPSSGFHFRAERTDASGTIWWKALKKNKCWDAIFSLRQKACSGVCK